MAQVIKLGENAIVERTLRQADGSLLAFADLTYAAVKLWQGRMLRATLVLGEDAELRAGSDAYKIELEITEEIRALLRPGADLWLEWFTHVDDDDFTVDSATHKDAAHDPAIDVFQLA
jgi:hypothetical protein